MHAHTHKHTRIDRGSDTNTHTRSDIHTHRYQDTKTLVYQYKVECGCVCLWVQVVLHGFVRFCMVVYSKNGPQLHFSSNLILGCASTCCLLQYRIAFPSAYWSWANVWAHIGCSSMRSNIGTCASMHRRKFYHRHVTSHYLHHWMSDCHCAMT